MRILAFRVLRFGSDSNRASTGVLIQNVLVPIELEIGRALIHQAYQFQVGLLGKGHVEWAYLQVVAAAFALINRPKLFLLARNTFGLSMDPSGSLVNPQRLHHETY